MSQINGKIIQYCGFKIGQEEYAIPVMEVQEVIRPLPVTPVPLSQSKIRGLLNLRGQIVTCLSLRKLFGLEDNLETQFMNIIVSEGDDLFSLVVDEVTDIIDVTEEKQENAPDTLNPDLKKYVSKIFKKESGLVILLDVSKLIIRANDTGGKIDQPEI